MIIRDFLQLKYPFGSIVGAISFFVLAFFAIHRNAETLMIFFMDNLNHSLLAIILSLALVDTILEVCALLGLAVSWFIGKR